MNEASNLYRETQAMKHLYDVPHGMTVRDQMHMPLPPAMDQKYAKSLETYAGAVIPEQFLTVMDLPSEQLEAHLEVILAKK